MKPAGIKPIGILRSIRFPTTAFTLKYLTLLRLEDMAGYHQLYNELREKKK